ncbi:MAG: Holliday junction resolvase RuvX [Planctomycetes bacterium]|nr:Holliday junction resolvase RuvX [Planctomycetota bacterium]
MRILAVDLGEKRTGLAISTPDERMALALPTLVHADAASVTRVAQEQAVEMIVVGLPLNMDGTVGPRAAAAQEFAEELRHLVTMPVTLWDERLSTAEGEARLRQAGLSRRDRAKRSDAAAAIVILEAFLASRRKRAL